MMLSSIRSEGLSLEDKGHSTSFTSLPPRRSESVNLPSMVQAHPRFTNGGTKKEYPTQTRRDKTASALDKFDSTPKYTRRLIRKIGVDPCALSEDFDEQEWYKKVYGPDIIVVSYDCPSGWVIVDGNLLFPRN